MKPVYQATTQLLIEKEYTQLAYQEGITVDISGTDYYLTQYKIIKSRSLARKVIEELHLDEHPEFTSANEDTVDLFLKRIIVRPIRNTRLVNLSAESHSPELATKIANTLAEFYVMQNLENRLFASREILKKLPEGVSLEKLADKELIATLPSVTNHPLIQSLKGEYIRLEAQLAELSKQYKDKHPTMLRLRAHIGELRKKIEIETNDVIESIRTELSGEFKANNVRIVDFAEKPDSPIKPKKRLNIALAIFIGLFGGIWLAYFVEYMDNTVKSEQDVEEDLKMASLGIIPKIKTHNKRDGLDRYTFANLQPKSIASESMKAIRSNIIFSAPKERMKILLVTSVGPQEGKTIASINLGITFAQFGERVLLVDADLRRPFLHKIMSVEKNKGLSNYLICESEFDSIVKKTEIENLNIVCSGPQPPNPSELLGSERFKEFIELSRNKFDRVIIDSSPVMSVSDTINVTNFVDGVIQVVHCGKTNRELVNRVKQKLESAGGKIIGAILNEVDLKSKRDYYYYGYYSPDEKS